MVHRLVVSYGTPDDPAPHLIAELRVDSEQAMGEALASPEARATGRDLANFATGGVTFAHFDVQTVNRRG